MRRTLSLAATGTLVIALLLAGCSSDAATLPSASTTAASSGDTTPAGDTTPSDGTTSFEGDANSEYCQLVRKYDEESGLFDDLFATDTPDPAEVEAAFGGMKDIIDQLVASAPAEVKADAQVMGASTQKMVDLLAEYDYDLMALLASEDANALNELFNSAEVATASEHLDQYDQQVCGIDVGS